MKIVDLFSGIGGFSLAASWVWGDALDIACFCERDEFCQKVLRKHWPHVPIVEDVCDLESIVANAKRWELQRWRKSSWVRESERETKSEGHQRQRVRYSFVDSYPTVDLITAGFPCQPASTAGRRKGTQDDRWLWPPLLDAIRNAAPRWLLLENVPGLLSLEAGMVFEQCCLDLENEGYEVQPLLIPACGVNAPHKRERLWIVGYSNGRRWGQRRRTNIQNEDAKQTDCHAANAGRQVSQERRGQEREWSHPAAGSGHGEQWQEHWHEVAARTCIRRMDDGISERVDGRNRVNRLKALGNSIVPQVAAKIMTAIKNMDNTDDF